jgi:PEP-CTERM motif
VFSFILYFGEIDMNFTTNRVTTLALAAALALSGLSTQAQATTLADLLVPGQTISFDDKTFSEFAFSAENIYHPTTNVLLTAQEAASLITVVAGVIGTNPSSVNGVNIGLDFMTPFHAHGGTLSALHIDFKATVVGTPYLISDVHLDGSPSVSGDGQATAVTTVNDATHTLVPLLPPGLLKIQDYGSASTQPVVLNDMAFLVTPVKSVWTETDVEFSAAPGSNTEFAHVQVSFSQAVPEPSTYAMVLSGLTAMGWLGNRRKKQAAQAQA